MLHVAAAEREALVLCVAERAQWPVGVHSLQAHLEWELAGLAGHKTCSIGFSFLFTAKP